MFLTDDVTFAKNVYLSIRGKYIKYGAKPVDVDRDCWQLCETV